MPTDCLDLVALPEPLVSIPASKDINLTSVHVLHHGGKGDPDAFADLSANAGATTIILNFTLNRIFVI